MQALLQAKVQDEARYLPFGKQYFLLLKDLEKPQSAATSLSKAASAKPKAKQAAKKRKAAPPKED